MKYYFTFMQRQPMLKDHYLCIEGSWSESRQKVFEVIGDKWCFQYSEKQWEEIRSLFHTEISLEKAKEIIDACKH